MVFKQISIGAPLTAFDRAAMGSALRYGPLRGLPLRIACAVVRGGFF